MKKLRSFLNSKLILFLFSFFTQSVFAEPSICVGSQIGSTGTLLTDLKRKIDPCAQYVQGVPMAASNLAVYSNKDLSQENTKVTHTIITIHGNAENSTASFAALCTNLHCTSPNTAYRVIIAPHLGAEKKNPLKKKNPSANVLSWASNEWKAGLIKSDSQKKESPHDIEFGSEYDDQDPHEEIQVVKQEPKSNLERISSYTSINNLIDVVLNKYPNLAHLKIVGLSAGGQFVQRYATSRLLTGVLKNKFGKEIKVSFLISSPSSYLYYNDLRIKNTVRNTQCNQKKCLLKKDDFTNLERSMSNTKESIKSKDGIESVVEIGPTCKKYNKYKYGMEDIPPQLRESIIVDHFLQNDVGIVVNTGDAQGGGKTSSGTISTPTNYCSDRVQGLDGTQSRMLRGLIFKKYLDLFFPINNTKIYLIDGANMNNPDGNTQKFGCGHDEFCVYATAQVRNLLQGENSEVSYKY